MAKTRQRKVATCPSNGPSTASNSAIIFFESSLCQFLNVRLPLSYVTLVILLLHTGKSNFISFFCMKQINMKMQNCFEGLLIIIVTVSEKYTYFFKKKNNYKYMLNDLFYFCTFVTGYIFFLCQQL